MKKLGFLIILGLSLLATLPMDAQGRGLKRKVAIGRFSNETQYGKGIFYNKENDPMAKQALDILSTKLANSGKFILLEREDLDIVAKEKGEEMQKVGADYIILGSITEFGRKNQGEQKLFSSTKTQSVEAGVSLRLVDAATGQIIYSDEGHGFAETTSSQTLGMGGTAGYDASLSDKAISAAIGQLVENIINKCTDRPWRAYILAKEGNDYILSGGASQGIAPGDEFKVYQRGKKVKNPQTGGTIELPGSIVGYLTVTATLGDGPENEFCICSLTGSVDTNNLENYYVSDK